MTMTTHASSPPVLELLFPGRVDEFLASYPTRPFHHDGPLERLPAFVAELSLERLIAVYRGDVGLHSGDSRPVTLHDPPADALAWLAQRSEGITFEQIERVIEGLDTWCDALREPLGLPTHAVRPRCNAFASPPSAGYRFHFHYEGALLVQLAGVKRVRLAPVQAPYPVVQTDDNQAFEGEFALEPRPMAAHAQFAATGFPAPPGEGEGDEHELAPGSVLYIPPGYWHATRSYGGRSFAFSVFLATPRLYEGYLRALELAVLTDAAWREPVTLRGPGATSTARLEAMRSRLAEVAARLRIEDVRVCLGGGEPLTPQSTLCPNLDVRWSTEPTPDGAAFSIHSDRSYAFEAQEPAASVLRSLLRRTAPFTMADALHGTGAGSDDVVRSAVELLEDLGFIVRAPFALDVEVRAR